MAANVVGSLLVELRTNHAKFVQGMNNANRSLKRIQKSASQLNTVMYALGGAFAVKQIVNTIAEFDKLKATLRTVTGSVEAATSSFNRLKEFATETPYQLAEVVTSFVKLKALGLDPSLESLRSYGNTASAMGKNLNQFIEAVADAATGEFERLKEFGIKARSQGEEVSFTFQGVTTTVKKNAAEIEEYLKGIGETTFAGAMKEQMNTLGGAMSNLGDASANLANAIGDAGLTGTLKYATGQVKNFAVTLTLIANASQSNIVAAQDMTEEWKIFAFAIFKLKQEFKDLGDWIGAVGAIVVSAAKFDFSNIDAIIEERKRKREELEQETLDFVARINNIGGTTTPENQTKDNLNAVGAVGVVDAIEEKNKIEIEKKSEHNERIIQLEQDKIDQLNQLEAEHWAYLKKIRLQNMTAIEKFNSLSWKNQTKTVLGEMVSMTQGVATSNRTLFRINKAAALANAAVHMPEHISNTMSKYPYPISIAMGALAAAASLAQIQAISSASFGGGVAPSIAPTGATSTVATVQPDIPTQVTQERSSGATEINITFSGDVYGWDDYIETRVIEGIKDAIDRDVQVI